MFLKGMGSGNVLELPGTGEIEGRKLVKLTLSYHNIILTKTVVESSAIETYLFVTVA